MGEECFRCGALDRDLDLVTSVPELNCEREGLERERVRGEEEEEEDEERERDRQTETDRQRQRNRQRERERVRERKREIERDRQDIHNFRQTRVSVYTKQLYQGFLLQNNAKLFCVCVVKR